MTVEEAYIKFVIKLNKNLNSNNITADPSRFVITFNENLSRRVIDVIGDGNDEDIRSIQEFLVSGELTDSETKEDRFLFKLPKDYLDFSSGYAKASLGKCKDKQLDIWEIKDKNYTDKLSDEFSKPSFSYREAPFIVANSKIQIFKSDFTISKVVLNYYKYPTYIDIEGYTTIAGDPSTSINPEGSDRFLNKVISMTVEDFQRNYSDTAGVQFSKDRIINNN